jgi:hypothetical protein
MNSFLIIDTICLLKIKTHIDLSDILNNTRIKKLRVRID